MQQTYLFPEQKEKLVLDELVNKNLLDEEEPPVMVNIGV
jgi:hypothetical protein